MTVSCVVVPTCCVIDIWIDTQMMDNGAAAGGDNGELQEVTMLSALLCRCAVVPVVVVIVWSCGHAILLLGFCFDEFSQAWIDGILK
jgi:hypothetical protein